MFQGFDDEQTPEETTREYLRQNPARELSMWMEWVLVVCQRLKIAPPTAAEWDALTARWHHDKMPLTSADELQAMRRSANTAAVQACRPEDRALLATPAGAEMLAKAVAAINSEPPNVRAKRGQTAPQE